MLLVCPNCESAFRIKPEALGEKGRSVRCQACRHVWHADAADLKAEVPVLSMSDDRVALAPSVLPPPADAPERPQAPDSPAEIDSPSIVPDTPDITSQDTETPAESATRRTRVQPASVEALARKRARGTSPRRPSLSKRLKLPGGIKLPDLATLRTHPRLIQSAGVAVLCIGLLIFWRNELVRMIPALASLYASTGMNINIRGIEFQNLATTIEHQDGIPILVVSGQLHNITSAPAPVPRLRLAVRDKGEREVFIWSAMPPKSALAPSETVGFRSRLASPPNNGHDVMVRFFNKNDVSQTGK